MFGEAAVVAKLDELNEEYRNHAPNPKLWLWMIVIWLAAIPFFTLVQKAGVTCEGLTAVCPVNVTEPFDCNRMWCCPDEYAKYPDAIKDPSLESWNEMYTSAEPFNYRKNVFFRISVNIPNSITAYNDIILTIANVTCKLSL